MPYGVVYRVTFDRVAVTAAQDLFLLITASGVPIEILSIDIDQSSDFGDAQAEGGAVRMRQGMTTNGSGGSTPTPVGPGTASTTAHANDTTASSAGTIVEWEDLAFNWQSGFHWRATPVEQMPVPASAKWALNLPVAPADSLTVSGVVRFRELA